MSNDEPFSPLPMSPRQLPVSFKVHQDNEVAAQVEVEDADYSKQHFLEYGMIVSFFSDDYEGFIVSDGFASVDLFLESVKESKKHTGEFSFSHHFKDCLFEITPKYAYEATELLDKFCGGYQSCDNEARQRVTEQKFKSEAEKRLNGIIYEKLLGTRVKYGEVIQLKHVKSKKFITISNSDILDVDKDVHQLSVLNGSSKAHFTIQPKYKLRKKGEEVHLLDQLVFFSDIDKQDSCIFVGGRIGKEAKTRSLYASSINLASWKTSLYERQHLHNKLITEHKPAPKVMKGGICIRILHLETNSWLCLNKGENQPENYTSSFKGDFAVSTDKHSEKNSQMISPDSIWEVELIPFHKGGPVSYNSALRLRHLCSGHYLSILPLCKKTTNLASVLLTKHYNRKFFPNDESFGIGSTATISDKRACDFAFLPTTSVSSSNLVAEGSVIRLKSVQSNGYIHIHSEHVPVSDETSHMQDLTSVVECVEGIRDEDAFRVTLVDEREVDDVLLLRSYTPVLQTYIRHFKSKIPKKSIDCSRMFTETCRILKSLISFCNDPLLSKIDKQHRQRLFRFQNYIEILAEVLKAPFSIYQGPYSISEIKRYTEGDNATLNYSMKFESHSQSVEYTKKLESINYIIQILQLTNSLMSHICEDFLENQEFVVKIVAPIWINLTGNGFGASMPLSSLLKNNRSLIESLDESIIRRFLDLVKQKDQTCHYLQFLSVLCISNGQGIPRMQDAICEVLFNHQYGYTSSIVLETQPSKTDSIEVILPNEQRNRWITIDDLFAQKNLNRIEKSIYSSTAKHFLALLCLYDALCFDRNYASIQQVSKLLPRHALLNCMLNLNLPVVLRTAFCKLILSVYVDCEPLKYINVPSTTRIWNNLNDKIPCYQFDSKLDASKKESDLEFFKKLLRWIKTFFTELNGKLIVKDTNTCKNIFQVVRLCRRLVEFGMYSKVKKLQTLVQNLALVLDGVNDLMEEKLNNQFHQKNQQKASSLNDSSFDYSTKNMVEASLEAQDMMTEKDKQNQLYRLRTMEVSSKSNYKPASVVFPSIATKKVLSAQDDNSSISDDTPIKAKNANHKQGMLKHVFRKRSLSTAIPFSTGVYTPVTSNNEMLLNIKDEICSILLYIDNYRIEFQVSSVLMYLKQHFGNDISSVSNWSELFQHNNNIINIFDDKVSPLAKYTFQKKTLDCPYSLNELAQRDMNALLMQLVMYEHPPLVSKALTLLLRQFNQHEYLLQSLSKIQLLVTEEKVKIYETLVAYVNELCTLSETTETWLDLTSSKDMEIANKVCTLLDRLSDIMRPFAKPNLWETKDIVSVDLINLESDNEKLNLPVSGSGNQKCEIGFDNNFEIKRLMRNLDVSNYVINLIHDGCHFFEAYFSSIKASSPSQCKASSSIFSFDCLSYSKQEQKNTIHKVFQKCFSFLMLFCEDSFINQSLLVEHVPYFLDFIGHIPESHYLLSNIYSKNYELCSTVSSDVIYSFMKAVKLYGHQERFLLFLESLIRFDGLPIVRNQDIFLIHLAQPYFYTDIVHLLHESCSKEEMLLKIINDTSNSNSSEIDYHAALLHLIATTAMGDNQKTKTVCQSIINISLLITILQLPSCPLKLILPIIRSLKEVYFDAEDYKISSRNVECILGCFNRALKQGFFNFLLFLKEEDSRMISDNHLSALDITTFTKSEQFTFIVYILVPAILSLMKNGNVLSLLHVFNTARNTADEINKCMFLFFKAFATSTFFNSNGEAQDNLYSLFVSFDELLDSEHTNHWYLYSNRQDRPNFSDWPREISIHDQFYENIQAYLEKESRLSKSKETTKPSKITKEGISSRLESNSPILRLPIDSTEKKECTEEELALSRKMSFPNMIRSFGFVKKLSAWKQKSKDIYTHPSPIKWRKRANTSAVQGTETQLLLEERSLIYGFLCSLRDNKEVCEAINEEINQMMKCILNVEDVIRSYYDSLMIPCNIQITFMNVVLKMVAHVMDSENEKFTKMTVIILDIIRQMIKTAQCDVSRHEMQSKLMALGCVELVIKQISYSSDESVFMHAVELGIALLNGMNIRVQECFYNYWVQHKEVLFFERLKFHIDNASSLAKSEYSEQYREHLSVKSQYNPNKAMSKKRSIVKRFSKEQSDLFSMGVDHKSRNTSFNIIRILRFLQLLCEGHFLPVQNYLILQVQCPTQVNIVDATINYLLEIHKSLSLKNISIVTQLFETVTEFCQGPCYKAQEVVANYKFISAVNALLMHCRHEESTNADTYVAQKSGRRKLRGSIIITLLSLLEGRNDSIIHDRLADELNFDVLMDTLVEVYQYFQKSYKDKYSGNEACSEDMYLMVGFDIYILFQHLQCNRSSLNSIILPLERKMSSYNMINQGDRCHGHTMLQGQNGIYTEAYKFFQSYVSYVEVVWIDDTLIPIYFPIHPICFSLTDTSKEELILHVSRGPTRLLDFLRRADELMNEMQHQSSLLKNRTLSILASKGEFFKTIVFSISVIINVMLLAFVEVTSLNALPSVRIAFLNEKDGELAFNKFISVLGIFQIGFCSLVLVSFLINSAPLLIMQGWRAENFAPKDYHHKVFDQQNIEQENIRSAYEFEDSTIELNKTNRVRLMPSMNGSIFEILRACVLSLWFLFRNPLVFYYLLFIFIAFMGAFYHHLFFSFHLLDVIYRYHELTNVLRAITRPWKVLFLTMMLYMIVVYIFAVIGFYFFRRDYTPGVGISATFFRCQDIFKCFWTTLDQGFKNDGGLGGFLSVRELGVDDLSYARLAFDFFYNAILIIVLLNIVFGIIIDTFASLRSLQKEKLDDMANRCFICSLDGYTFDRMTKRGFEHHKKKEHNLWHYLALFVHIRKKALTEYNGVELYLARLMSKKDTSFFPNHRTIALENLKKKETIKRIHPSHSIEAISSNIATKNENEDRRVLFAKANSTNPFTMRSNESMSGSVNDSAIPLKTDAFHQLMKEFQLQQAEIINYCVELKDEINKVKKLLPSPRGQRVNIMPKPTDVLPNIELSVKTTDSNMSPNASQQANLMAKRNKKQLRIEIDDGESTEVTKSVSGRS